MSERPAVSTEAGLIEVFRARKDELGLSNTTCDEILNRVSGYVDHYLGRCDKALVSQAFTTFCELLAIEFVPRPSVAAARRMEAVWDRRNGAQIRVAHSISRHLIDRARPIFYAEKAIQLTNGRKKIPPAKRSQIARRAARARYRKPGSNEIKRAAKP